MRQDCFVQTISERCRVCYTCVRECPAKAIRISEGQAEIISERCIGCANCVRVCSQQAKQVVSSIEEVDDLLASDCMVAACVAPSFPAEFTDYDYRCVVGALRAMGFDLVNEVAFGADLVASEYRKLLAEKTADKHYISTACPAIVSFVEKYHPGLVGSLAPIVSPMVAEARVLHQLHGNDLKVVFIGPCVAKKWESSDKDVPDEIDAVLTFSEFREMASERRIDFLTVEPFDFDPPHARLGTLFPISKGMLQAADIAEDLISGEVVATDGKTNFVGAIKEFENGSFDARLLDVLACTGCIMGAGMTTDSPLFSRRSEVSDYTRLQSLQRGRGVWKTAMEVFGDLDMSRVFTPYDQRIPEPGRERISHIMSKMGKHKPEDELNCGACGYDTCRAHAIAIFKGLAENEMCLPHTIEQLRMTIDKLAMSDKQLATAREALMQSEKLASMGQLAAGIAHEINNPLGVVLMYSHLLLEQVGDQPQFGDDLNIIVEQTDRCKKIVAQLLHFARQNKLQFKSVDIYELVKHLLNTLPRAENIKVSLENTIDEPIVEVDPDQIIQVITNLIDNACSAMVDGGLLTICLFDNDREVGIAISDIGVGISKDNITKIFDPFFTTKKIGKGTGLGLAVAYGIVKMHNGNIKVESNDLSENGLTGTKFIVTIPREKAVICE